MTGRVYIAIDLKSFYASVELAERKYDPLAVNLVVADKSRTEKTICLAVSPSLKAYGIPGRARLFEVVQRVKEINAERYKRALELGLLPRNPVTGKYVFSGSSFDANDLAADPSLELSYIVAPPRMLLYEQISTRILGVYLQYVSAEDIHVYSIDECFIDVTGYLKTYHTTARSLAARIVRDVLRSAGITATVGIGTNMYLAKVAMDIMAKRVPPGQDGVRIAELDEKEYRRLLWCHMPLTDFWRIGAGTARRLAAVGCFTMGDIARKSLVDEQKLYDILGINAELLIDHAWGWEPTEISMIQSYQPDDTSLSSGQVLAEPYPAKKAKIIVREMTELLSLDLVRKGMITRQVALTIVYDPGSIVTACQAQTAKDSVFYTASTGQRYTGDIAHDHYGRIYPKPAHGSANLSRWTNSSRRIITAMLELYDRITDPDFSVRRIYIAVCGLFPEQRMPAEAPRQLDFFTDYAAIEKRRAEEEKDDEKEKQLQKTTLTVLDKFGKNALLKGTDLQEGATTIQRNAQIGGHQAGDIPENHNS